MSSSRDPGNSATGNPPTQTRRLRWWISGVTFVVGFVLGVVAVGLLSAGTPDFAAGSAGKGTGPNPSVASSPAGSVPVVAEARVNAACLAVINEAQDTFNVMTGVDQAVTDVDLQALDEIVRRLQPIRDRLGVDLQKCHVDTSVAGNPTSSASAQPSTPQPSATR